MNRKLITPLRCSYIIKGQSESGKASGVARMGLKHINKFLKNATSYHLLCCVQPMFEIEQWCKTVPPLPTTYVTEMMVSVRHRF